MNKKIKYYFYGAVIAYLLVEQSVLYLLNKPHSNFVLAATIFLLVLLFDFSKLEKILILVKKEMLKLNPSNYF